MKAIAMGVHVADVLARPVEEIPAPTGRVATAQNSMNTCGGATKRWRPRISAAHAASARA